MKEVKLWWQDKLTMEIIRAANQGYDAEVSVVTYSLNKKAINDKSKFRILLIPKGVQPGQLLVLRGKGLPPPRPGILADQGDQYVRFRIHFPTELNERQRAILEEFAKEEINSGDSTPDVGNWLRQFLLSSCQPCACYKCYCCGMINLKELSLVSGKSAWMAYLIYDGALFDSALLAAVAAFSHSQILVVSLNNDGEIVVVSKEDEGGKLGKEAVNKEKRKLSLKNTPFSLTGFLYKNYILSDPIAEEESILETLVTVVLGNPSS